MPQRLQMVARCLVVLTGNFLNMVASSSFMTRSFGDFDTREESNAGASLSASSTMQKMAEYHMVTNLQARKVLGFMSKIDLISLYLYKYLLVSVLNFVKSLLSSLNAPVV